MKAIPHDPDHRRHRRKNKCSNFHFWILAILVFWMGIIRYLKPQQYEPSVKEVTNKSEKINLKAQGNSIIPHGNETSTIEMATEDIRTILAPMESRTQATSSKILPASDYPLASLGIKSAKESYERGFWQQMEPVPLERWAAVDNTTCRRTQQPQNPMNDWQRRVPFAMIIGAQKGGTTALAAYLNQHPHIIRPKRKEWRFFDEELDQNPGLIISTAADSSSNISITDGGIPAAKALEYYQQTTIGSMVPLAKFQFEHQQRIFDATPHYLFLSDRAPHRIFCIIPWRIKFLAILRNPIDRAFSQYHMQFNRALKHPEKYRRYRHATSAPTNNTSSSSSATMNTIQSFLTFEEFIQWDIDVLQETGVIQDWSKVNFTTFHGSAKEQQAWSVYTKLGLNSPLGKGLYAIQLRQWFQTMEKEYQRPREDLFVMSSEQFQQTPHTLYPHIVQKVLKLPPPHHLSRYPRHHTTTYRYTGMNPQTRQTLYAFFRPYNQQLKELLGPTWDYIWEEPT